MKVRRALVLMAVSLSAGAGLIIFLSAQAAGHWTSGSYQVFVDGKPFGTWVLGQVGVVSPYDVATWSIEKNVFTLTSYLPPIPPCSPYVRVNCCTNSVRTQSVTFSGRKTADGIASPSAPGLYTENVDSTVIFFSTFWAVREGGVPRRSN